MKYVDKNVRVLSGNESDGYKESIMTIHLPEEVVKIIRDYRDTLTLGTTDSSEKSLRKE